MTSSTNGIAANKNKKIYFDDNGETSAKAPKADTIKKQQKGKGKPVEHQKPKNSEFHKKPAKNNFGKPTEIKKPQKIIFDVDEDDVVETTADKQSKTEANEKPSKAAAGNSEKKPKKIKFNEEGDAVTQVEPKPEEDEDDYFTKREQQQRQKKQQNSKDDEAQQKWYNVFKQYPCSDEILEMKENDQMELYNLCKNAFEADKQVFNKRNPADARWLHTALHKGTAKDRANAGALLVTSNPLGNLEALNTLIGFCKTSNKSSNEVINILTDLWKEVLLPPHRKLISLQLRGADWKHLRKDPEITKERQKRVYSYWYFENELKDAYHEFLKNIMQGLQTGQEHNKNASIVSASHLLAYAPEKEQMLLTMLINKLGDPVAKIASKALHHLSEVAHRHPNMCGVIVVEAEKLLFRNNISERAQHFALCFLSSIAPAGRPEVCTKLVNICFALFKVLVQKGAVNNRTMQAILRCLQKAIVEAKPANGSAELLNKEMQDTVYRLVHLADIRVSVQTLGLLLQLMTVKTEKTDRFYNALYVKLLDLNLINIGTKTAAQLLHIVHRAIHIDTHRARALAFIKRLLQLALYTPPHISAGCLIVIHKVLRTRKELIGIGEPANAAADDALQADGEVLTPKVKPEDEELAKFDDSDGEEKYEDIKDQSLSATVEPEKEDTTIETKSASPIAGSWHHAKVKGVKDETKVREVAASKYDAYHRVPAFAGAEYTLRNELHLLRQHYHPTVQVFAENIIKQQRIEYYGDPLRDFGLPHFLERFAFKNPKKLDNQKAETPIITHKNYVAYGPRGKPVKTLTKSTCTEDEMYIFNFLEQKRQKAALIEQNLKAKKLKKADDGEGGDDADELMEGEVDDDEFEAYLDGYFSKKGKKAAKDGDDVAVDADVDASEDEDDEDLDFLKELGGELKSAKDKKSKKKQKMGADDEDMEDDVDADWGDDDDDVEIDEDAEDDDDAKFQADNSDLSDDEDGSIDLDNEDDDSDGGSISLDDNDDDDDDEDEDDNDNDSDDELAPPKAKKSRQKLAPALNERGFTKKLKNSTNMSSLFAAADDFAELLEETGKTKGQGTINAVYNKDKSSDKQLKWEEKRRSNTKNYKSKKSAGNKFAKKHKSK